MNPYKIGQFSQQFSSNQDRFIVINDFPLFAAVFDGHGDSDHAAAFLQEKLYPTIQAALQTRNYSEIQSHITNLDNDFNSKSHDISGSTIAAVYIDHLGTIAFTLGDSRIYSQTNTFHQVSFDHSVENEASQIISRGGKIVQNLLLYDHCYFANARSFGDAKVKKFISNQIEFFEIEINFDFLFLCSDGVSSFLTQKEMGEVLRKNLANPYVACREIVREAARAQLREVDAQDDCTAILVVRSKIFDLPVIKQRYKIDSLKFKRSVDEFEEVIERQCEELIKGAKSARELRRGKRRGNLPEIVRQEGFQIDEFVLSLNGLNKLSLEEDDEMMKMLE